MRYSRLGIFIKTFKKKRKSIKIEKKKTDYVNIILVICLFITLIFFIFK